MKVLMNVLAVLVFTCGLVAQQPAKPANESNARHEPSDSESAKGNESFYKLVFVFFEMDEGKRTNQREYTLIGKSGGPSVSLRVGTRVPVFTEEKKMQYVDVGLDLRCPLSAESAGKLRLDCNFNLSNFMVPDQASDTRNSTGAPVLRNMSTQGSALLTLGKPTLISSIDDLNSKKKTQIEVTATRVD